MLTRCFFLSLLGLLLSSPSLSAQQLSAEIITPPDSMHEPSKREAGKREAGKGEAENRGPTNGEPAEKTFFISIIIDDIGNSLRLGERAINLPGDITYAVLPHRPHGQNLAVQANQQEKEIMLHAPMSNIHNIPLGLGALTANLNQQEFTEVLRRAIVSIPYIKGVNNHMGSDLTEKSTQMNWLMEELQRQKLYFVDSRTSGNSVARKIAKQKRVPSLSRNIFLDNDIDPIAIDGRFKELIAMAKRNVGAVAIGHPHRETLTYLETAIPALQEQNIELISISAMLEKMHGALISETLVETLLERKADEMPAPLQAGGPLVNSE